MRGTINSGGNAMGSIGSIAISKLAGTKDRHQESPSLCTRMGSVPVRVCTPDYRVPDLPCSVVAGIRSSARCCRLWDQSTPGTCQGQMVRSQPHEVVGGYAENVVQIGRKQGRICGPKVVFGSASISGRFYRSLKREQR